MVDYTGMSMGNYKLLRLIGSGGFADVYEGEHIHLGTPAAIKVLKIQIATVNLGDDFLNEAKTIVSLRHPNIVRVLEFSREDDTSFLVMDYAPGGTLRQHFPRGFKQSPQTILPYVKQIASALQYAHDKLVVHRDVKPENIFLGPNNEVLLGDFGISLILEASNSSRYQETKDIVGTVNYMAPEQIEGKIRRAIDQYALGIMVYEWLTGACPFHGTSEEIARQQMFAKPEPLHDKVPTLSPEINKVVQKALAKDPDRRYPTIQAFAEALENVIGVRPPPPPRKPGRRAVLVGGLAILGAGALACTITRLPLFFPSSASASVGTTYYVYRGHSGSVLTAAWSFDGTLIASGSEDTTAQVWDTTTGNTKLTYRGHKGSVESLDWLPNTNSIVSSGDDRVEKIWDATTGKTILTHHGHSASVYAVACSPDGKRIASGGRDKAVEVWEASTGRHLFTYTSHVGDIGAVTWSPDSKRVASASYDGTVQVWDAATGRLIFKYTGHKDGVFTAAWSPDGKTIASGGKDKTVQLWDPTNGNLIASYNDHADYVEVVAWSSDSTHVASGSDDKTVIVWNVSTGSKVASYEKHSGKVFVVTWSPGGKRIASGSEDHTVQVWQAI